VALVTETNVPHADNIAYFGDGTNEAQLVYNFSLPPLLLHAFHSGDAQILMRWAASLTLPSPQTTFFNFLASHDGIGVTPARGLLSDAQVEALAQRVLALGGHVSYRSNPNGSQSAYELNINYLDALGNPAEPHAPPEPLARRFLAAQAIMLALRGVPGVYFHSLFGSHGWPAGVQASGRHRTINREKLQRDQLEAELADPGTLRYQVFHAYMQLLQQRGAHAAFHPAGEQQVLDLHPAIFALLRSAPDRGEHVLCLHNVSDRAVSFPVALQALPAAFRQPATDLIAGRQLAPQHGQLHVNLESYQTAWYLAR